MRLPLLVVVFLVFTGLSTYLTVTEGYFGFLVIASRERWMVQVLTDLGISLTVAWAFLIPDGRKRGLPVWPYVGATAFLGSIAVLAYLIHRELAGKRA